MILRTTSAAAALVLLLAGCASTPDIKSTRAPDFDPSPKKIFFWSKLEHTKSGAMFGPEFSRPFTERLVQDLRACGAEVTVFAETGLELDESEFNAATARSQADAVLIMSKQRGSLNQYGGLTSIWWNVGLFASANRGQTVLEANRKKVKVPQVWSAEAYLNGARWGSTLQEKAARFADDLTNQLKGDGFFPGCAPIAPKPKAPAAE